MIPDYLESLFNTPLVTLLGLGQSSGTVELNLWVVNHFWTVSIVFLLEDQTS